MKNERSKKFLTVITVCLLSIIIFGFTTFAAEQGDLNKDGKITAADARIVLRISARLQTPTDEELFAADVNGDKVIEASDARLILRVSAKLDKFPEIPSNEEPAADETTTAKLTTTEPTTAEPTTAEPTTPEPTTEETTAEEPITPESTTEEPTTAEPATEEPSTEEPATEEPTTPEPTTEEPTTAEPTTEEPTTPEPTTEEPTTPEPTTEEPTTPEPTTAALGFTTEEDYETGLTYEMLARTPDKYIGEKVKLSGSVFQVIEGGYETAVMFHVDDSSEKIVHGVFENLITNVRVLEDDNITVYGTFTGIYTYTTVLGAQKSVLGVSIDKIVIEGYEEPDSEESSSEEFTTEEPTTEEPSAPETTTEEPTTAEPTTEEPTTEKPTEPSANNGKIEASYKEVKMSKGGTACIPINVAPPKVDLAYSLENSSAFRITWSDWYTSSSSGKYIIFLFVSALESDDGDYKIHVYSKNDPSIGCDINVNVSTDRVVDYGGRFAGMPDFGSFAGIAPENCILTDDAKGAGFFYSINDITNLGYTIDSISDKFEDELYGLGYRYVERNYADDGSYTDSYINSQTGRCITVGPFIYNGEIESLMIGCFL